MTASNNTNTSTPTVGDKRDSSQMDIIADAELIEAGWTDVDSTSSAALYKETIKGLEKISIGSVALKASVDTKLNTLNKSISTLKEEIVQLNALMARQTAANEAQSKEKKIRWAISNSEVNAFTYYERGFPHDLKKRHLLWLIGR